MHPGADHYKDKLSFLPRQGKLSWHECLLLKTGVAMRVSVQHTHGSQRHPYSEKQRIFSCLQCINSRKFRLYDYGSRRANRQQYGSNQPPDIAAQYGQLKMPIDLLGGKFDGIIDLENIVMHYSHMKKAGCHVTFKTFLYGHLDFTFAVREDLRHYVLSRLLLES